MSIDNFYPGILRVIVEQANLDEEPGGKQVGDRDNGPIPAFAIITRAIDIYFTPFLPRFVPLVEASASTHKVVQQATNSLRRQALQLRIATRPLIGSVFPLNMAENTLGNRTMHQSDRFNLIAH